MRRKEENRKILKLRFYLTLPLKPYLDLFWMNLFTRIGPVSLLHFSDIWQYWTKRASWLGFRDYPGICWFYHLQFQILNICKYFWQIFWQRVLSMWLILLRHKKDDNQDFWHQPHFIILSSAISSLCPSSTLPFTSKTISFVETIYMLIVY